MLRVRRRQSVRAVPAEQLPDLTGEAGAGFLCEDCSDFLQCRLLFGGCFGGCFFRFTGKYRKELVGDSSKEIPLFVELNRAPGIFGRWYKGTEGMQSSFIRMEICRQLLKSEELADVPENMIRDITEEFKTVKEGGPRYLLLLDGLNEVNINEVFDKDTKVNGQELSGYVRWLIIEEIIFLLTKCPNIRIILTSRTDETEINCTEYKIEKLYLTGLKTDTIEEYLTTKAFSVDDINSALGNERLVECIKVPLFLTMYADLHNVNRVISRGEILKSFFYEKNEIIKYSQQKIIRGYKFKKHHLRFILDFLIPAIASEMEHAGEFAVTAKNIGKIIEPILKGWRPTQEGVFPTDDGDPYEASVIGEYGKRCFDEYTMGRNTIETVADEILEQGKNMTSIIFFK